MPTEKLIYVDDSLPGITRKGAGKGWAYFDPKGMLIKDRNEKKRLNAVALPPAYRDAWYCPAHNGHILATGYDDKARKQYRYHPDFRMMKEGEKFDRCGAFGKLLPLVRKRVEQDLSQEGIRRDRVIASIVRLLDLGFVRIGNEGYAKRNKNFGATTLKQRHAEVDGDAIHLTYRGKSGKDRDITVNDEALSELVEELQDLPGQDLFQFVDEFGTRHPISSSDVNAYLRETMGENFTAKSFRTWHASVLAYAMLASTDEDLAIKDMLAEVSDRLGNTPAVVRSSYIHPAVIELVGRQREWRSDLDLPRKTKHQSRHERGLIALLEEAPSAEELLAT
ncbi:DNA topoisomerase IB [Pontixanthobacter gangjinensis]|uniref:DNA topoisomerase n=1 Tax=Pontixanthobacter gangjinensis TaxID=1028742 RepID=A0A6I4SLJ0_9SPHN|nr:DNA topoisomerase IB [Pontixanthobacter gangjinensis]MXO56595.1 DNA topoisomerase IB [Pontixanthobacter gangjinensis]